VAQRNDLCHGCFSRAFRRASEAESPSRRCRSLPKSEQERWRLAHGRRERSRRRPHDLNRFVQAQEGDYERALAEVRTGRKRSHWMWYIFRSSTARVSVTASGTPIKSIAEAERT